MILFWAALAALTVLYIEAETISESDSKLPRLILTIYLLAHGVFYTFWRILNHKNLRKM